MINKDLHFVASGMEWKTEKTLTMFTERGYQNPLLCFIVIFQNKIKISSIFLF